MNIVLGIFLLSLASCPPPSSTAVISKRETPTEESVDNDNQVDNEADTLEDILDSIETVAILGADTLSSFVDTQKEIQNVSAKVYKTVNESPRVQNALQSKIAFLRIVASLIEMAIRIKLDMGRAAVCIVTCLLQFDPEKILECKRKSNCVVPATSRK